jgi:hypothetical protein
MPTNSPNRLWRNAGKMMEELEHFSAFDPLNSILAGPES